MLRLAQSRHAGACHKRRVWCSPKRRAIQPAPKAICIGLQAADRCWCTSSRCLAYILRKRVDASRSRGFPWPNPAASNERLASLCWLIRPSSEFSKPTGSPRPMMFVHTSAANSIRPGCRSSATCPAQCPGSSHCCPWGGPALRITLRLCSGYRECPST